MLDEILDYVKFLRLQVKVLSMSSLGGAGAVAQLVSDIPFSVKAVGFNGDVRKQEDAARVLAATIQHFGKLDILVYGAAGNFLASPEDLTPKGFRTDLSWA